MKVQRSLTRCAMLIRRIEPNDLVSLLQLYQELHPADDPPSADAVRTVWPQLLADPHVTVFVGAIDGTVVCTCTLVTVPNLTRGARPYGLIENVVTLRRHRREGLGTAAVQHALAHAWELGCYKVMLLAGSQREEAQRFYEQAGFRPGLKVGYVAHPPACES